MWMSVSSSRWVCLFTLAVLVLFSAVQVTSNLYINLPCCTPTGYRALNDITKCTKQTERPGCKSAYEIVAGGKTYCVQPTPQWLKDLLNSGVLTCKPDFEKGLYAVQDEDDVEEDDVDEDDMEW